MISMVGTTNDVTINAVFGLFIFGIQLIYYGVAGKSKRKIEVSTPSGGHVYSWSASEF